MKIVVLALWLVALAACAVWVRDKFLSDGRRARRIAWLGTWQIAGPMLAMATALYLAMNFFVAVYAYPPADFAEYAPGLAEMSLVLWSGLLTGALATLARGSLKGRA